jgi:hypothetical protein
VEVAFRKKGKEEVKKDYGIPFSEGKVPERAPCGGIQQLSIYCMDV